MTREKEEILYFKTEKERMAYLRNRVTIEPIEYVEPKEEETVKVVQTEEEPKKKRGKKKNVAKEVQTD
jgi:hypothetical protein